RACVATRVAAPRRPQDRVPLHNAKSGFKAALETLQAGAKKAVTSGAAVATAVADSGSVAVAPVEQLEHGSGVIAAITSCTNTSNPSVMIAAGLLAKKAVEHGLSTRPWVKPRLAPGSKVVTEYLSEAGLQHYLDQTGFSLVGYGCTTCIGNSGPLPDNVADTVIQNVMIVSAVLSGNRNFEGRIHPQVKANWLASPPLVVAFALAGTTQIDLSKDALGSDKNGNPFYLKEIWPSNAEVASEVAKISNKMFRQQYADVFAGTTDWQNMKIA